MLWVSLVLLFLNVVLLAITANYYVQWKTEKVLRKQLQDKCNEKPLRDSKGRFVKQK